MLNLQQSDLRLTLTLNLTCISSFMFTGTSMCVKRQAIVRCHI